VGFDEHSKTLGRNANGTNTALPIFIDFMKNAKKFLMQKPFKIPKGIKLRKIDSESGGPPTDNPRNSMIEAFKEDEDNDLQPNITEVKRRKNIINLLNEDENGENRNRTSNNVILDNDPLEEIKPVFGIY
jgi:membrane carboxypeptidase/penicillin-binding protein